ncbi:MAG TPA: xanthine dehydrogenase family protein molybdopterin-binding subunit [Xanthobacteraceae bacterium]|nr:xanthine dehydrogenase family protein molybdopterin-binding subunit [Xanthobacteraceae bacterium]
MGVRYFGAAVPRIEDPDLVAGRGRYLDDIALPGMAHAAFVRATHAHARIDGIETAAAAALPGVIAVLTAADLGVAGKPTPQFAPSPLMLQNRTQHVLAAEAVHYAGEAIALVVADSRAVAEDAAARVAVDYVPLAAVAELAGALDPGAPRAHAGAPDNRVATLRAKFGDVDAVFGRASHVFAERITQHRGGCHAMECRGVIGAEDPITRDLVVWSSTQAPYMVRRALAQFLGRDESRIRVIAPQVGGGFGPKAGVYAEEFAIAIAAQKLGRPVKWAEDRREHFLATNQQRDAIWELEVAADRDGRMLGVRGHCLHDNGAYVPYGLILPFTLIGPMPGPYALAALDVTLEAVFTNKVPTTPIRGAGRPNAAFVLERLADRVARELGIDRAAVRRASFIAKDQFPYATGMKARDGSPVTYDSGDYHACLEAAVARVADFSARQSAARAHGRYLGLGIASYVEDTGLGPYEGAQVSIEPNGHVLIATGAAAQGQGHHTVFAQIAADILDLPLAHVRVVSADTGRFPRGIGTIGSRIAVTAGSSVHVAATRVKDKALKVAAEMLEAAETDLALEDGRVRVAGTDRAVGLGEIAARLAGFSAVALPKGVEPGLSADGYFQGQGLAFASGTNVCEVEVDAATGAVRILRYVVAHDCGRLINPLLVDGQIRGGVVHGIGNALHEHMVFDGEAQPMTTNYGDYLLPIATDMPPIEVIHLESPSPQNPLGVKGAGEGGTIPATACVISAIEDALSPLGVTISEHPVSPQRLAELIAAARKRQAS